MLRGFAQGRASFRPSWYNRYFSEKTPGAIEAMPTTENTMGDDEAAHLSPEPNQRHFDRFCEGIPPGQRFVSDLEGVGGVRRRVQTRLAVNRNAWIEPLGSGREPFYEQRLLLALAWYCDEKPERHEDGTVEWHFRWAKPASSELRGGVVLPDFELFLGRNQISFEEKCKEIDECLSHWRYGLVCSCCAGQFRDGKQCIACEHAVVWVKYGPYTE